MTQLPAKPMLWVALASTLVLLATVAIIIVDGLTLIRGASAVLLTFSVTMALFEAARRAGWLGR
jgi:hypothetical protein